MHDFAVKSSFVTRRQFRECEGTSANGVATDSAPCDTRRKLLQHGWIPFLLLFPKHAGASPSNDDTSDPVVNIKAARETLQILLSNWEKAVIDCTFADVPRELLEQRNKEELLEKASTFALFDKSVSVETCRTTNKTVRQYLGASGIGPVVGVEKQLKLALDRVKADSLDEYVMEIERIEQNLSKARSLSYTAGMADFNSVNNFEKDQIKAVLADDSNLEQARRSIEQIVESLKKIDGMLE